MFRNTYHRGGMQMGGTYRPGYDFFRWESEKHPGVLSLVEDWNSSSARASITWLCRYEHAELPDPEAIIIILDDGTLQGPYRGGADHPKRRIDLDPAVQAAWDAVRATYTTLRDPKWVDAYRFGHSYLRLPDLIARESLLYFREPRAWSRERVTEVDIPQYKLRIFPYHSEGWSGIGLPSRRGWKICYGPISDKLSESESAVYLDRGFDGRSASAVIGNPNYGLPDEPCVSEEYLAAYSLLAQAILDKFPHAEGPLSAVVSSRNGLQGWGMYEMRDLRKDPKIKKLVEAFAQI